MKATGMVRSIDSLGRVVIPMEIRREMNIQEGDSLEIFTDDNGSIILKKYQRGCINCGSFDNLKALPNGDLVCEKCIKGAR